jgi:Holliday junction resolvase
MRGGKEGRQRERQVAEKLREDGYVVLKGTTYGSCDLAAFKRGYVPMLIEVKSTAGGPYQTFGPAERQALLLDAHQAGARAVLAWWPPRKQMRLIPSSEWPADRLVRAA